MLVHHGARGRPVTDSKYSINVHTDIDGEVPPGAPTDVRTGGTAAAPLSKAHISPQDWPGVIWSEGASVLKVSKGGHCDAVGGGMRGIISGFSDDSRRRLLYTIGRVRRDAELPLFVTMTYPYTFPTVRQSKRDLDTFLKRFRREFPGAGLIWKLEPQERGAPHYHMLVWGVPLVTVDEKVMTISGLKYFVPITWYEIAGGGDVNHLRWHMGELGNKHCVQPVRSWRGVWAYAAKYLGKTFEVSGWDNPGRFWGVVQRHNIPFGEERRMEVDRKIACNMQRYQRRFAHIKTRGRSMTTFCDAGQWVNRLLVESGSKW